MHRKTSELYLIITPRTRHVAKRNVKERVIVRENRIGDKAIGNAASVLPLFGILNEFKGK